MRNRILALVLLAAPAAAQAPLPFASGETLEYSVNWPSGLSLGKARFSAERSEPGEAGRTQWTFRFHIDAAIPSFHVLDDYEAQADEELCSIRFLKKLQHGKRVANEEITFDQQARRAQRKTLGGGGASALEIPECGRDALTFFYFLRRELARGRIPPPDKIVFGALYEVRLQPAGGQRVAVRGKPYEADQLTVTVKGPASEAIFLLLVARDEARTPVRITVPLEPGSFTMELAAE